MGPRGGSVSLRSSRLVVGSCLGISPGGWRSGWMREAAPRVAMVTGLFFFFFFPSQPGGSRWEAQVRCRRRQRQRGRHDWAARQSPQVPRARAGGNTWP